MMVLMLVMTICGVAAEYLMMRSINREKAKISEAVFVSCAPFALTMPLSAPFWVAGVGIVFGIVFTKGEFGGFGRNIFNPAIAAGCFVYISFPSFMTVSWTEPFKGFPGGLVRYANAADAATRSTPLMELGETGEAPGLLKLITGSTDGSLGDTAAILIVIAAIYLILTKTASWKTTLSYLTGFLVLESILYFAGLTPASPIYSALSGGFLFGTVFMVTEPVTFPNKDLEKIIFGFSVGRTTVVIRTFPLFTEGMMFMILAGNMFVPLLERGVKGLREKKGRPA
jgi:Na+-transporting NADH:ubiquinone oxidoreductase subunit B